MAGSPQSQTNRKVDFERFASLPRMTALTIISMTLAASPYLTNRATLILITLAILIHHTYTTVIPRLRAKKREKEIANSFPDALDLILICVEAGQALNQAIALVAQHMTNHSPTLAQELRQITIEINAGKEKRTAFQDFAVRCNNPDISAFVSALSQSASFGTPISEAIRSFSSEMREKRYMRAEERANTIPTKMTLATMILTVPPLLLVLIGPSLYEMYIALKPNEG